MSSTLPTWLLLLVPLAITACNAPESPGLTTQALTPTEAEPAASAAQPEANTARLQAMGIWQRIGVFDGAIYSPLPNDVNWMVIDAASIVHLNTTACGPRTPWRKWRYAVDAAGEMTTTRLGDFIGCPPTQSFEDFQYSAYTTGPQYYRMNSADRMEWTIGGNWVELWERRASL